MGLNVTYYSVRTDQSQIHSLRLFHIIITDEDILQCKYSTHMYDMHEYDMTYEIKTVRTALVVIYP